jgi:hypothetical protein
MISNLLPSKGNGVQLLVGAPVQLGCSWSMSTPVRMIVNELLEGVTFWFARGVRRQVTRDNMQRRGGRGESAKITAAAQVGCGIGLSHTGVWPIRYLASIWIPIGQELCWWAGTMAAIAVAGYVHDVAAQSDEISIFSSSVRLDGRYSITDLDRELLILRAIVVLYETVLRIRSIVPKVDQQHENGHQNERGCQEMILQP